MPEFTRIGTVEASPHKVGTAYVAGNRYLLDDFAPYLYRTDDFGATWTRITTGIPDGHFLRSVREDVARPGMLYAGTEKGVWISWDNGRTWRSLSINLPVVQVSDLAVEDNDLVIATHGRSFWVLPNIGSLRQMDRVLLPANRSATQLFPPTPAVRGVDAGVTVDYFVPTAGRQVTLDFLDAQGRVIRSFASRAPSDSGTARGRGAGPGGGGGEGGGGRGGAPPAPTNRAGINRFVWNLRYPGFTDFPGMILWAAGNNGPMAVPGRYQVRLTVDGQAMTQPFEVKLDPRVQNVAIADLQRRFDLAIQIRDRVTQANEAVIAIRDLNSQIDDRIQRANDPAIAQAGAALKQSLAAVEGELYQVRNRSSQDPLNYPIKLNNKIAALMGTVESAEAAPTSQSFEVFRDLSAKLDAELARLNSTLDRSLGAFNQQLQQKGLPVVTRPPIKA
jgi:hypothetical protein